MFELDFRFHCVAHVTHHHHREIPFGEWRVVQTRHDHVETKLVLIDDVHRARLRGCDCHMGGSDRKTIGMRFGARQLDVRRDAIAGGMLVAVWRQMKADWSCDVRTLMIL
jgi:hypothetical protein